MCNIIVVELGHIYGWNNLTFDSFNTCRNEQIGQLSRNEMTSKLENCGCSKIMLRLLEWKERETKTTKIALSPTQYHHLLYHLTHSNQGRQCSTGFTKNRKF